MDYETINQAYVAELQDPLRGSTLRANGSPRYDDAIVCLPSYQHLGIASDIRSKEHTGQCLASIEV